MTERPRITLAPDVVAGKPVIRGTRLSVEFVIGLVADGWSEPDILRNCPRHTHDDIIACLAYTCDLPRPAILHDASWAPVFRYREWVGGGRTLLM